MKKLLTLTTLLASTGAVAAADLEICVEGAYPPFSQTQADGTVTGFDIDIANALCSEIGKSCEMVSVDWDGIIPALLELKCDAIIASMSITEKRREVVEFTQRYYQTPARFFARDGKFDSDDPETLGGARIGVQRGTIYDDFLVAEYPNVEVVRYATQDEVYLDLVNDRLDAAMADSVAASDGFLKTENGEGFAFFGNDHNDAQYFGDGAGIALRKEDVALRDMLSDAIETLRDTGTYQQINAQYFEFDIYGE